VEKPKKGRSTLKVDRISIIILLLMIVTVAWHAISYNVQAQDEFVFACIHVGPLNDGGWTQAHDEGCVYAEEQNPGSRMIAVELFFDGTETMSEAVGRMIREDNVQLFLTTSDAFEELTIEVALEYPDVVFINISGDDAATGEAPPNMGNFTGQLLIPRMIAGCAAALTTQTGHIGLVGPLINYETRRDQSSAYLGAHYCWDNYRELDSVEFTVSWVNYWFYRGGTDNDPTLITQDFLASGIDVIINGIDTPEPQHEITRARNNGQDVYFIGTDSATVCDSADPADVCLGTQFYGWQSLYAETVASVMSGTWEQSFVWYGPDYDNIHDPMLSPVGFVYGEGLSDDNRVILDEFIEYLEENTGENTLPLWCGPLNYQSGALLVAEGECLPAFQLQSLGPSVWYQEELLEGMTGASE